EAATYPSAGANRRPSCICILDDKNSFSRSHARSRRRSLSSVSLGPLTDEQAEASSIRSLPVRFRQVRHCWPAPPYGHCLSLQKLPSLLRWSLHRHCGPEGASRHHQERLLKMVQVLEVQQACLLRQVRLQPVWSFRSVAVRL